MARRRRFRYAACHQLIYNNGADDLISNNAADDFSHHDRAHVILNVEPTG